MRIRRTALALAAVAVIAIDASAVAVQTTTFKLAATGPRTRLSHAAGSGAVRDTIVVADLSNDPLTLNLSVIGATAKPDGNFALGVLGQGLAGHVHLEDTTVSLAAHQSRVVHVVIDTPSQLDQPEYAAITALPVQSVTNGIGVQTQLALLVEVTPATAGSAAAARHSDGGSGVDIIAPAIAAALIAMGIAALLVRRRRMAA